MKPFLINQVPYIISGPAVLFLPVGGILKWKKGHFSNIKLILELYLK